MLNSVLIPPEALKIALLLLLSLLMGLEREEHKLHDAQYAFGGIRTFPLIGLTGYGLALLSDSSPLPFCAGFLIVGGFLLLSYRHKLAAYETSGVTTEVSGLIAYIVGTLIYRDHLWIASTLAIISLLLLEFKLGLERLTKYIQSDEIIAFTKFLVLTVVILPIVPNREFTQFHINPLKTWLVVVAVSGVSYGSYLLQRALQGRGGVFLSAVLGGAYSSTVTTLVLARQGKEDSHPNLFAGSILAASGVMYARLALLMALFNRGLMLKLAPAFAALAVLGGVAGFIISRRPDGKAPLEPRQVEKNPLELKAALLFALIFIAMLVVTNLARLYLGRLGLYALAAVMGATDVDPFILGITQSSALPLVPSAVAIGIAAASNNVMKGIYALSFAGRQTGRRSFLFLLALALFGCLPFVFM
jgi:uncharacterized membrane protein (DUF4010 family)